ncbi:FadR/GntR family transcriptional regulator [Frigidibacter mobilis]|uniref:GntR family transcriptional regulator n=1 Tax=Frigidibacter mobilis TaxID=1335048 RepID=A0A159Z5F2_9RHOB|nr:FCD domain-containing protein [Frigidibacter mobilis]AMY70477.1 GntR family transcriptional regulator [Frigidibacter mobilis]
MGAEQAVRFADAQDDGLSPVTEAILRIQAQDGFLPAERSLAQRLNIKRHLLRRALLALRHRGELPQPRPRRSLPAAGRVGGIARDTNPVEVMELRLMIEPPLARLAAVRASPNQIAQMLALVDGGGHSGGSAADLHRLIAAASGNALARVIHDMVRSIDHEVRLTAHAGNLHPANDADEHRAIVEAIAGRNPEAAEAAMRVHLASIHRVLSAILG